MKGKKEFEKRVETQIGALEAQIVELKAKAARKSADERIGIEEQIEELTQLGAELKFKLNEMKKTDGEAWYHLKLGAEKALGDITFNRARAVIKVKEELG
jgi:hypothetical protein